MSKLLAQRVVSSFGLTPDQKEAALERDRDVVVTAGAGSGKTRTLVARYASLLADGFRPRRVAAITFTEKAAREMRSRVRDTLIELTQNAESDDEQQMWQTLSTQMDSARISTIHSLCAEILRAHPAEAGVDPRFEILEEGIASALRAQVVDDTLSGFVENPIFTPLFEILTISSLKNLLKFLIEHRLEAREAFEQKFESATIILQGIENALQHPEISNAITDLRNTSLSVLENDGRAAMVNDLLALWKISEDALASGDMMNCAIALHQARREKMNLAAGKRSQIKDTIKTLQMAYDNMLDPFIGGQDKSYKPDKEIEARFAVLEPLLPQAFEILSRNYADAKRQRQALDFDDLESGAEILLSREDIRSTWQGELDALLVDEFQDTNARQRKIVEALSGYAGRLFVVGDARQSIYRFRRADVTVFRSIRQRILQSGGRVLDLDKTYRAHEPLLNATGDLLGAVMGTDDDPFRPYYVPFSPLDAHRKDVPKHINHPHIELIFGASSDTGNARPVMAKALAKRLLELKAEEQIGSWEEVALLFRAASGFSCYENAFEEAGIPFVTVAGRGFYDRPEIRDVLNLLRCLVDPADDLAMAGLLRSPAFGLTDAALYQLRKQGDRVVPYWLALQGDITILDIVDQERAQRTAKILNQLLPQVDRIPVAELLKQLVDATDYRAILAAEGESSSGGRLWRNLDKLLADAQASGQVNVRDFLDYLTTLSDAGVREGEAPADAQGVVRLMTIHKSKGLEFPVVVLADAGKEAHVGGDQAYLLPEIGLTVKLDPSPMLHRLAKWQDGLQSEAESLRILYVALTRAKDKLIISGHTTPSSKGEWKSPEWIGAIADTIQINLTELVNQAGTAILTQTSSGHPIRAIAMVADDEDKNIESEAGSIPSETSEALPLYQPVIEPLPIIESYDEPEEKHLWRATGAGVHVPPGVIGKMVHKAIELWLFADNSRLIPFLETAVLSAGLASPEQRVEAIRRTMELLQRLHAHPIWDEINSCQERYHEVPYSHMVGECAETGYIDLLYLASNGWQVVDFKTDSIHSAKVREELIEQYSRQMQRYFGAVEVLLEQPAHVSICFLDDNGRVGVVAI